MGVIVDQTQNCVIQMPVVFSLKRLPDLIQRVIAEFLIEVMALAQLRL
jgi:hypothetical protein